MFSQSRKKTAGGGGGNSGPNAVVVSEPQEQNEKKKKHHKKNVWCCGGTKVSYLPEVTDDDMKEHKGERPRSVKYHMEEVDGKVARRRDHIVEEKCDKDSESAFIIMTTLSDGSETGLETTGCGDKVRSSMGRKKTDKVETKMDMEARDNEEKEEEVEDVDDYNPEYTMHTSPSQKKYTFEWVEKGQSTKGRKKQSGKKMKNKKKNRLACIEEEKEDVSSTAGDTNSILDNYNIFDYVEWIQDFFHSGLSPSTTGNIYAASIAGAEMFCIAEQCGCSAQQQPNNYNDNKKGCRQSSFEDDYSSSLKFQEDAYGDSCVDGCTDLIFEEIDTVDGTSTFGDYSSSMREEYCDQDENSIDASLNTYPVNKTSFKNRKQRLIHRNHPRYRRGGSEDTGDEDFVVASSDVVVSLLAANDEDIYNYNEDLSFEKCYETLSAAGESTKGSMFCNE